jgi:hypothetical protein
MGFLFCKSAIRLSMFAAFLTVTSFVGEFYASAQAPAGDGSSRTIGDKLAKALPHRSAGNQAVDLPTSPPANDMFANSQVISSTNSFVTGTNADATVESGEP